jgi:very-short-patch-repair endonuclease
LRFDFYLPKYNTCIEFDGKQHFEPVKIFGGNENFKEIIKKDSIKNMYCDTNGIKLIRIKYDQSMDEIISALSHILS